MLGRLRVPQVPHKVCIVALYVCVCVCGIQLVPRNEVPSASALSMFSYDIIDIIDNVGIKETFRIPGRAYSAKSTVRGELRRRKRVQGARGKKGSPWRGGEERRGRNGQHLVADGVFLRVYPFGLSITHYSRGRDTGRERVPSADRNRVERREPINRVDEKTAAGDRTRAIRLC